MKLIALQLHGFKSFADPTGIHIHGGITAVIGPNGCGKSNISDALRWVLGEQRASAIRGARMEEAIFQGTERRKPIQRAEVTLVLSNEDARLAVPYTEVRISRTLFRGGESEYSLNGTPCRLRDILDLCRDTGLGANAYAVIEARMIDAILSDRADERRALFEEAAGIGRYKERRRMAIRRLDEAEQDLARLNDVIAEVESKVRSLAQQRGRARRYLEIRERKLALEIALADRELASVADAEERIAAELAALQDAEAAEAAALHTAEADFERLKARGLELERQRAEAGRAVQESRDRIAEQEQIRALAEERVRNGRLRLEQIARELDALTARRAELEAELCSHRGREREVAAQLEALVHRRSEAERRLAELDASRRDVEARRDELEQARARRVQREAALRGELEAIEQRAREAALGVEEVDGRIRACEKERVEAAERLDATRRSLEGVRAALARAIRDLEEARRWESEAQLREQQARAALAAARERLAATEARRAELEAEEGEGGGANPAVRALLQARDAIPGVHGLLADFLRVPAAYTAAVESLLGEYLEAVVVENAATVEAVRRWFAQVDGKDGVCLLPLDVVGDGAQLPAPLAADEPGARWVARLLEGVRVLTGPLPPARGPAISDSGESEDRYGAIRLGRTGASGRRLSRRRVLERLGQELETLAGAQARGAAELDEGTSALDEVRIRVRELEEVRRSRAEEQGQLEGELRALQVLQEHVSREEASLQARRQALETERAELLRRAATLEADLQSLGAQPGAPEPTPDGLAILQEWEAAHDALSALRVEEAQLAATLDARTRDLTAATRALEEVAARAGALMGEQAALEKAVAAAGADSAAAAERLEALFRARQAAESELARLDEEMAAVRHRLGDLESAIRQAQRNMRERSERRHALELKRSELGGAAARVRERLEAEWGRPLDALRAGIAIPEGETEALRGELAEVTERLSRLGPVNMLAEEEYRDESERLAFLQSQREDLVRARDDLRATIREVNETASAAFTQTFEAIRANFQRTFQTLFEGGRCDVWMEDPQEPLESPIEISASPSGKRIQRIHLLSGGERALTALALLFAIYLVKPSPFCLLDEVDAPLDEANILRFVRMLEEFKSETQFIVITHNPRTIEAADWVYGVTMEEPGVSKIVGVEFAGLARENVA